MKIGDLVEYDLRASHGGDLGQAYVIGHMAYAKDGSVVLLADEKGVGMPINVAHCKVLSTGHGIAERFRQRYVGLYGAKQLSPDDAGGRQDG